MALSVQQNIFRKHNKFSGWQENRYRGTLVWLSCLLLVSFEAVICVEERRVTTQETAA